MTAVVVKIGGAAAVNPQEALDDVASLRAEGKRVVVVHGGSTAMDDALEKMGIEPEYVETPDGVVGRFTDEEAMDVFKMALPGLVNTDLVEGLQNAGVNAVGLSGVDGQLLKGPRKSAVRVVEDGKKKIKRGDHSGTIEVVNEDLLATLLDAGYTPVVSVPMLGVEDDGSFTAVNSDADRSAAAVAGALGGDLVLLTDVTGVYADPEDPTTRIARVDTPEEFAALTEAAGGFMRRKVMAAEEALSRGSERVVVATANADAPITAALDGDGTTITRDAISGGKE
ncbi:acetylglutamate/acetylaminoadipate kinase [Halocalculus aciditolerans]|uniref:Putative [LysW]-aminoadipate/[LysW]-glutamate kinase n=1 Tax=Halocalculus aciditolerans TaxID=1383812 RepID=A0A830FAH8_9EURY|nr:acetylglutamate/acetylaminoadipate kinase [Halocalculus aciditolerans]GGL70417.1 acetylglutamate kinase [Halocalculus aciditolerans]